MALELTFVNQYGNDIPKRRRLAKACASCRLRKKRCIHVSTQRKQNDHTSDVLENGDPSDAANASPANPSAWRREGVDHGVDSSDDRDQSNEAGSVDEHISGSHSRRHTLHRSSASTHSARRFVSDLNPEATLLQSFTPLAENARVPRQNDDIGIWVDRREWEALVKQKNNSSNPGNSGNAVTDGPLSRLALRSMPRPHSAVLAPLIDIYFRKIHPILPLLDEAEFRQNHAGGIVPEPLAHAMCLVAAKDKDAEPHLRLNDNANDNTLAPREFCSRLHASVLEALTAPCRYEKITLIRILALASLHAEGPDGGEEASGLLNQAMHYTQTLGWHLGQHIGASSSDGVATKRLFWCLYSLDRIHSSMYSRPIMMSDVDIAIEPYKSGESGFPAFEAFLYLCQMLNKVIGFYRPGQPLSVTGWEEDFPSFEDAIDSHDAWQLPQETHATLHLFYLQIAVLSHRSRGVKYTIRSTASYVRQSLCAIELNRLMTSDLFSSLHPLPFLPYAISLAMSVAYQRLRQSQLTHQQEDAREDFRTCYVVLQTLRRTWASADIIATIAKKVLEELDKVKDLSTFRVSRSTLGQASPAICPASLNNPDTLIDRRLLDKDTQVAVDPDASAHNPLPRNDGFGLFEGMDDVFGTYLDPNYPINLDDFSFIDSTEPFDWNQVPSPVG